jgi:imidazoleglycerol phosphate dehydratase HisB
MKTTRAIELQRQTAETNIELSLVLDGSGTSAINTGIGIFDHLLTSLAKHARWDLRLSCAGDLEVDDHHSVEDCGLALGMALDRILGERRGIARFAHAYAPLDEALVRSVIDLSGRGGAWVELPIQRESIGTLSSENVPHFFRSLASTARLTLHLDLIRGENAHHIAEAAFKSFALAIRGATALDATAGMPSTKGTL